MYNFIDVNEASEGVVLPSEAMKINGEYIENQISGYRTLSVSGREALSPILEENETGVRDGSTLKSRRYPSRIITVKYQLIAKSNEDFREAFNALGRILNIEEAELIFDDEPDKFFIGTPSVIGSVEPGLNAVVGEFEILCTDPFKYSVYEYEAAPAEGENAVVFNYNGTYKAFPKLEAAFFKETEVKVEADGETEILVPLSKKGDESNGDCGYVAFFNEDEKIIQLGDPAEVDGETNAYPTSQTLMNQTFLDSTSWGTTAKSLWAVNQGVVPPVAVVSQVGALGMGYASKTTTHYSGTTSGNITTFYYDGFTIVVNYSTKNRTASAVTVSVSITAITATNFNKKYGTITALFTLNNAVRYITIKQASKVWEARSNYSTSVSYTISGLSASTTSLTGIKFSLSGIAGTPSCKNIAISPYTSSTYATYYITPQINTGYGEGSGWHGPSITRTLGADEAGEVGAANFTLTYEQKMCIDNTSSGQNEMGGFHVHLSDANGTVVAGVRVVKTKAGKAASLMLFVNGQKLHQVGIDISYYNQMFGASEKSVNTSTIKKAGNKLYFTIGGYAQTFTDDAITNLKVTKVTFMFEKHGTTAPLTYNGLYWAKFVKNNCTSYNDIPNKFSANDVVVADCRTAEIHLNGLSAPDLGALGNDWEGFVLKPGINQIGFGYSEWVKADYAPTFTVRYREVFL